VSTDQPTMLPTWLARRQVVDMRAGVNDDQALEKLVRAVLGYVFSESVKGAAGRLSGGVTAADIVGQILASHREYGNRLGGSVSLEPVRIPFMRPGEGLGRVVGVPVGPGV
jgi:hypothetical protein